jgi:hypothetical protein
MHPYQYIFLDSKVVAYPKFEQGPLIFHLMDHFYRLGHANHHEHHLIRYF